MTIENEYKLKQKVYLSTDSDQKPRIIIGLKACADGGLLYELISGTEVSWHYECEISSEQDIVLKTS